MTNICVCAIFEMVNQAIQIDIKHKIDSRALDARLTFINCRKIKGCHFPFKTLPINSIPSHKY